MVTVSYILSGDAAVYYEEYGTGEPLVLIHGLLGSVESHWRRFVPEYAKHFHTIAVDLRGHGKTNNPSRLLRLPQFVDDLHKLLDTLQIERVLLCGYSLGGYIALAYAIRCPEKVRAVVMHGTKFSWTAEAVAEATTSLDPQVAEAKVPEWTIALAKNHSPGNGPQGWRNLMAAARPFLTTLPAEGISQETLSGVRCPVLVSVCDGDPTIPRAEAEQLATALPGGKINVFEGCKHPLQSVPKHPFIEVTTRFFQSCFPQTPG